jgi:small subunit ribosomal protein S4
MKKKCYKPLYKNFIRLRKNIQNRDKLYNFKKKKWQKFLKLVLKLKKQKVRVYDHTIYYKPKFGFNFKNKFRFYLFSKRQLSLFYGNLSEKYLNQVCMKAYNKFKNQNNKYFVNKNSYFLEFLESRLDTILYRAQFTQSMRGAKQLISHGKVFINGKKIKINSYNIKKGDLIEIHPASQDYLKKKISLSKMKYILPKYLEINFKTFQCLVISDISYNKIMYNFPFWLNLNVLVK